jgi:hypothetical protein
MNFFEGEAAAINVVIPGVCTRRITSILPVSIPARSYGENRDYQHFSDV